MREFADQVRSAFAADDIVLYGSRAKGDHRKESNANVAVVLRGLEASEETDILLALSDVAYDVMLRHNIRISPMPIAIERWKTRDQQKDCRFLADIAEYGIRFSN